MPLNRVASLKTFQLFPKISLLIEQVTPLILIVPPSPIINNDLVEKAYICLVSATLRNRKIFFPLQTPLFLKFSSSTNLAS